MSEEDNTGMRENENTNKLAGVDRNTHTHKTQYTKHKTLAHGNFNDNMQSSL